MWTAIINREDLLELLTPNFRYRGIVSAGATDDLPQLPQKNLIIALWTLNPYETRILPSLLIIADGTSREFFAWTSTYIRELVPFTSFIRVVERSIAVDYFP